VSAVDAVHPKMFRVVYPDGALSADFYNLTRVKQHCHDIAHALYPRSRYGRSLAGCPADASKAEMANPTAPSVEPRTSDPVRMVPVQMRRHPFKRTQMGPMRGEH
jgi:hypothetical protein